LVKRKYLGTLFQIFLTLFLICLTFTFDGIESINQLISTFEQTSFFSLAILNFVLIYILSNWKQVDNRFNTSRLIYEEGSWYTSEIWEKPISLIKNDKLISTQILQPIVLRNFQFIVVLAFGIFALGFLSKT
jgi:hypothetical protein